MKALCYAVIVENDLTQFNYFYSFKGEWQETSSKKKKKQPSANKSDSVIDTKPEKREKSKEREYDDKPERDRDNYPRNDRRNRQPPRLASKLY